MAFRISCGNPERNEVAALNRLAKELPHDWALFTNIPRHLTGRGPKGREIDALALSPLGAVVIELKNLGGLITVMPPGEWFVAGRVLTDRQGNPQYPLQQAGKAAQVLKSALGAAVGNTYIEACAIATAESATIRFDDPLRPQPTMSMGDAVTGILALARKTRGVSHQSLQAFFALIGHRIPSNLDARWREQAAARASNYPPSSGRHTGTRSGKFSGNRHVSNAPKKTAISFGEIAITMLVGLMFALFLVYFVD
jgi:Nuclease-related domain